MSEGRIVTRVRPPDSKTSARESERSAAVLALEGETERHRTGLAGERDRLEALRLEQMRVAAERVDLSAALAAERTLFCDLMVNEECLQRMAQMNAGERDISDR